MRFRKSLLLLGLVAAGVLVLAGMQNTLHSTPAANQPIAFDHARHAQENLKCNQCHAGVENSAYATLPTVQACLMCHKEAKGNHPDEPKVRAYADKGEAIPWVQVNHVAGHVYFSHGMHVKLGKLDCNTCHGDMAHATEPVVRSQVDHLTMDRCMQCHEEHGVNQECLTCHK